ncbi:hypothetical protein Bbelb_082110 [Branchiostoma belcheri]|nr:hypothetical protein Bbelb_082110 [Branchiostoma belcheri]
MPICTITDESTISTTDARLLVTNECAARILVLPTRKRKDKSTVSTTDAGFSAQPDSAHSPYFVLTTCKRKDESTVSTTDAGFSAQPKGQVYSLNYRRRIERTARILFCPPVKERTSLQSQLPTQDSAHSPYFVLPTCKRKDESTVSTNDAGWSAQPERTSLQSQLPTQDSAHSPYFVLPTCKRKDKSTVSTTDAGFSAQPKGRVYSLIYRRGIQRTARMLFCPPIKERTSLQFQLPTQDSAHSPYFVLPTSKRKDESTVSTTDAGFSALPERTSQQSQLPTQDSANSPYFVLPTHKRKDESKVSTTDAGFSAQPEGRVYSLNYRRRIQRTAVMFFFPSVKERTSLQSQLLTQDSAHSPYFVLPTRNRKDESTVSTTDAGFRAQPKKKGRVYGLHYRRRIECTTRIFFCQPKRKDESTVSTTDAGLSKQPKKKGLVYGLHYRRRIECTTRIFFCPPKKEGRVYSLNYRRRIEYTARILFCPPKKEGRVYSLNYRRRINRAALMLFFPPIKESKSLRSQLPTQDSAHSPYFVLPTRKRKDESTVSTTDAGFSAQPKKEGRVYSFNYRRRIQRTARILFCPHIKEKRTSLQSQLPTQDSAHSPYFLLPTRKRKDESTVSTTDAGLSAQPERTSLQSQLPTQDSAHSPYFVLPTCKRKDKSTVSTTDAGFSAQPKGRVYSFNYRRRIQRTARILFCPPVKERTSLQSQLPTQDSAHCPYAVLPTHKRKDESTVSTTDAGLSAHKRKDESTVSTTDAGFSALPERTSQQSQLPTQDKPRSPYVVLPIRKRKDESTVSTTDAGFSAQPKKKGRVYGLNYRRRIECTTRILFCPPKKEGRVYSLNYRRRIQRTARILFCPHIKERTSLQSQLPTQDSAHSPYFILPTHKRKDESTVSTTDAGVERASQRRGARFRALKASVSERRRREPSRSTVLTRAACGKAPTGSYSSAGQLSGPWRDPEGILAGSRRAPVVYGH